jgi:hypothetical protein
MDDRPGPPTHGLELGRWVADLLGDRQALHQALRADPNTLKMLFANPRIVDPLGAGLVEMRAGFLSLEIYGSFGRYALSQLDRLEHNQRLADHRATVIRWIQDDPALELDAAAERLACEAKVAALTNADAVARARDYLKQLYRSMFDQGVIEGNDVRASDAICPILMAISRAADRGGGDHRRAERGRDRRGGARRAQAPRAGASAAYRGRARRAEAQDEGPA